MNRSLMFRDDEDVSGVVSRHLRTNVPNLIGSKRSVTFRMDLYDHARLNWLTETLGVHKSVLIRDLLAAAMADAIKELAPEDADRKKLQERFEQEAEVMAQDDESEVR